MKKKLLLFGTFLKFRLLMNFQFPVSYWLGFIGQFIFYGATFCVIFIAVSSFGNLAGWTADEVLLLYAFELISYAIGAFFCFHPSSGLVNNIRMGAFDASLTKPMNPFLFQICNYGLDAAYLSHFTLSLGVMILALLRIGIMPTLVNITMIILFILGAAAIQGGFLVLCSVFSFKMVNENPMFTLFFQSKIFLKYPISIYGGILQTFLTFVLPLGFINYYPAEFLLSKNSGIFNFQLGVITPLVGIGVFLLAYALWMWQLKHYNSSGS